MADMQFHSEDQDALQRMLGTHEPERCHPDLLKRYYRQLRFLHAGQGRGGPLGAAPLAALLDQLGLKPATEIQQESKPKRIDWNDVRLGQPVMVQLPNQALRKGVYAGRLPEGMLVIQFLDTGTGEIVLPRYVTLFDEVPAGIDPEGFGEERDTDLLSEDELDALETRAAMEPQAADGELDEELPGPSAFVQRWSKIPAGTKCQVEYEDDYVDMEYVGIFDESDTKLVFRHGKTDDVVVVEPSAVTIADEAVAVAIQEDEDVDDDL
jgi:hypothetical protein